jgi:DNA-binding transcriptional LysR family regulator
MNLLHLHYFYTVAKERGFTNASKVLRIQQPAISRMVGLLEDDVGFPLFEKVGRQVQLTKAGEEVFEHCKKIFTSVEDLKKSLGQISGEIKGPLHIATSDPIASSFLPSIIKALLEDHPEVYPNLYSGPAAMLFEKILQGDLDLGIFFHIPELPEKLEIFNTIPVRYRLVVRKDLKKNKKTLETFIGSREIDDTATRKFPTLERLRKDYPQAKIKISSNNLLAHRKMVLEGMGVSILPDFLIKEDLQTGQLADLYPREDFHFKMKFIKRKTAILTTSALELVRLCTTEVLS